MTREEFDLRSFQKIDPEPDRRRREKSSSQCWVAAVPLGFLLGLVFGGLAGSPTMVLPAWVISTFLIGGWLEGKCATNTKS